MTTNEIFETNLKLSLYQYKYFLNWFQTEVL